MKIVAFSDYHNNKGKVKVPDGDVLVVAGDASLFGRLDGFDDFISSLPHKHKLFVAGNHDNFAKRRDENIVIPSMTYLQDSSVTIDGIKFYGSPWHTVIGMAFGTTWGEMANRWAAIPDDTDVLITHMPPYGMLDGDPLRSSWGCPKLFDRVMEIKPRLHIFGHIHMAHGRDSMDGVQFANVALTDGNYKVVHQPTVIGI